MPGWGPIGRFAIGELPVSAASPAQVYGGAFSQFSPVKRAGIAVAVIATTAAGFVAPPPAQATVFTSFSQPQRKAFRPVAWTFSPQAQTAQTAVFTAFSQPLPSRIKLPDELPSALFEVELPIAPPFTGFARFDQVIRPKSQICLLAAFQSEQLFVPQPDTHDLVFMGDQFRKKKRRDLIDEEISRKERLRRDLEQAVYGPEVVYSPPAAAQPDPKAAPPNVEELARSILAAREAQANAQRAAIDEDDENVIEMILRDL